MDNARLDLVEGFVGVASSVDAHVVLVQGSEVVEETLWETHGSADYHDQLVCDAGEGSTEVEQDYGRETFDRRVTGNAGLCFAGFRGREFGRVGGGRRVEDPRSGVNVDDVVEALSPADEPVLLGVGPLGDGAGHGEVDRGSDGLVVGVFKTEGPSVLGGSFDAAEGVVVSGTFWEEDSEGVVESGGWFPSVHHQAHRQVEGGGAERAGGEPGSVGYPVRAGGAGFGALEEFQHGGLLWEFSFLKVHGGDVSLGELMSFVQVYAFGGKYLGPAIGESVGSSVRVLGGGSVASDDGQVNGLAVEGRP